MGRHPCLRRGRAQAEFISAKTGLRLSPRGFAPRAGPEGM